MVVIPNPTANGETRTSHFGVSFLSEKNLLLRNHHKKTNCSGDLGVKFAVSHQPEIDQGTRKRRESPLGITNLFSKRRNESKKVTLRKKKKTKSLLEHLWEFCFFRMDYLWSHEVNRHLRSIISDEQSNKSRPVCKRNSGKTGVAIWSFTIEKHKRSFLHIGASVKFEGGGCLLRVTKTCVCFFFRAYAPVRTKVVISKRLEKTVPTSVEEECL